MGFVREIPRLRFMAKTHAGPGQIEYFHGFVSFVQISNEPTWHGGAGHSSKRPFIAVTQVKFMHRPGYSHKGKAPFLLDFLGIGGIPRTTRQGKRAGKDSLLHGNHKHHGKFEAFGGM